MAIAGVFGPADVWGDIVEPAGRPAVTADSGNYTTDNATWPTADGGIIGALDYYEAEVVSGEAVGEGGGGFYHPLPVRLLPVVGRGYGILPELEGEAHGVVVPVAGAAAGALFGLASAADGVVCVGGGGAVRLPLGGTSVGDRGVAGEAFGVLQFAAFGSGTGGARGVGAGVIVKFTGAAVGHHVDEEAAIMALLLAA